MFVCFLLKFFHEPINFAHLWVVLNNHLRYSYQILGKPHPTQFLWFPQKLHDNVILAVSFNSLRHFLKFLQSSATQKFRICQSQKVRKTVENNLQLIIQVSSGLLQEWLVLEAPKVWQLYLKWSWRTTHKSVKKTTFYPFFHTQHPRTHAPNVETAGKLLGFVRNS